MLAYLIYSWLISLQHKLSVSVLCKQLPSRRSLLPPRDDSLQTSSDFYSGRGNPTRLLAQAGESWGNEHILFLRKRLQSATVIDDVQRRLSVEKLVQCSPWSRGAAHRCRGSRPRGLKTLMASAGTTSATNEESRMSVLLNELSTDIQKVTQDKQNDGEERETWQGRFDFIISCIGYCVGLGNVWKFPYLCYKNGGGAFLIPYVTTVILAGMPMYFLELALGQFYRKGALGIWSRMPAFKGVGFSFIVITCWLNMYYTVIMAWSLWYMFHSFRLTLPWVTCDNSWNTDACLASFADRPSACVNITSRINASDSYKTSFGNATGACVNGSARNSSVQYESPEIQFWFRYTLWQSSSISEPGLVHWKMALLLLLVWIICYFCIWKGIKWSGKIIYLTALLPYALMLVLLVRGATLPGAGEGIKFYLYPQLHRLADSQVWVDAASQVFYSTGVGFGAVIVMGSYNKRSHNMHKSAIVVATINSCTSITVGFAIFCILGFMAHTLGTSVADVSASGPGLAFIVYPSALSQLPAAPIWASLFFIMLFVVGLDTQFCMMEGFFASIIDEFPKMLRRRRKMFIAVTCLLSYLVGLSIVTQGGIYVFQLFDWYAGSRICLLFVVFFESVAVGWFYGAERFYQNIEQMIGFRPSPIFKYCWIVTTPLICAVRGRLPV
ncbi:sodium- and chloride-dependent GABA transporter 1-like isoform X2 [Liolophura sinensis]|uniref:sodium- and chloride-dependent GABA transporter 1-like isoform X2 n=1 Tax=Liolophura sinensis TaxID=3198878 RepID=UPI003158A55F